MTKYRISHYISYSELLAQCSMAFLAFPWLVFTGQTLRRFRSQWFWSCRAPCLIPRGCFLALSLCAQSFVCGNSWRMRAAAWLNRMYPSRWNARGRSLRRTVPRPCRVQLQDNISSHPRKTHTSWQCWDDPRVRSSYQAFKDIDLIE